MALFKKRPREEGGWSDDLSVIAVKIVAALPWSVALAIGGGVGRLISLLPFAKPHRIARINLALCFPEKPEAERRRLARRNMIITGKSVMAGAVSWVAPLEEMRAKISHVEGVELFDDAVKSGRGIIFLSPHMGCWEFINFYLCSRHELIILAKPFGGPALNELITAGRSRLRGKLVPTSEKGVRALLGALKHGGMTYLTPDHVPKDSAGIFAPFFGLSTPTGVLTSRLLQKTGALALAVTCTLRTDGNFDLRFISVENDVYSRDVVTSVSALNRVIERCVRMCPEQYQWAYRRFKRIEGRDSPY